MVRYRTSIIFAISLICLLSGCVSDGISTRDDSAKYDMVESYVAEGNSARALAEFEKIHSGPIEDPEIRGMYASLLISAGELERARALLEDEMDSDSRFSLAMVQSLMGNKEEERAILEKLAADEQDPRAFAAMGDIYRQEKSWDLAKASYQAGLQRDPGNLTANAGMGHLMIHEGQASAALPFFDRALESQPDLGFLYADRGQAKASVGDFSGALADFDRAIELNPDYYWHYVDRGKLRALYTTNRDGAVQDLTKAIELDGGIFYPYVYRAGVYEELGEFKKAKEDYHRVLEIQGDYYFAYAPLGILSFQEEEWDDAQAFLSKAYESEKDPLLAFIGALALQKKGDMEEASAILTPVVDQQDRTSLTYHVGRALLDPQYESVAYKEWEKAPADMEKTRMLYYFGEVALSLDRKDLALTYFQKMAETDLMATRESRLAQWELERLVD